jgi:hypothetical protein
MDRRTAVNTCESLVVLSLRSMSGISENKEY